MENAESRGGSPGSQFAGLPRREMVFLGGNAAIFFQKRGFDEELIGIPGKGRYFLNVGVAVGRIGNIGDFLPRRDMGNLPGQIAQSKRFFSPRFRGWDVEPCCRIGPVVQGLFKCRQPGARFEVKALAVKKSVAIDLARP